MSKFSTDQALAAALAVLLFTAVMTIVPTTHRSTIRCIEAGGSTYGGNGISMIKISKENPK